MLPSPPSKPLNPLSVWLCLFLAIELYHLVPCATFGFFPIIVVIASPLVLYPFDHIPPLQLVFFRRTMLWVGTPLTSTMFSYGLNCDLLVLCSLTRNFEAWNNVIRFCQNCSGNHRCVGFVTIWLKSCEMSLILKSVVSWPCHLLGTNIVCFLPHRRRLDDRWYLAPLSFSCVPKNGHKHWTKLDWFD